MKTVPEQHFDHSGGQQGATSWPLRAQNEVEEIINGRLDVEIGVITRRNGNAQEADTLQANKSGLGLHEAKFSTGTKMLAAINNSGDTKTVIKSLSGSTWTDLTLPGDLPVSTQVNFGESLDEVYAAGISAAGNRIAPINIKKDLTTSLTRNLIGAPDCRFITEYAGSLYAMNVKLNGTVYPDRAYKSSPAMSVITYVRGVQIVPSTNIMPVDTVRYLKAGMAIDIYNHKTDTVRYSNVTISSVDKANDTITLPALSGALSFTPLGVTIASDLITISDTTNFPTGTPVVLNTTTTLPGGLSVNTTYYVINISGTTLKLAATAADAAAGTAIDLTSVGYSQTFATTAVNTTTEVITLAGNLQIVTGTPISFTSTTTVPGGLTAGTQYYAIKVTNSTFKVATSEANAIAGTAINLTSQGTGTHTINAGNHTLYIPYTVDDNDEIYLTGRHGELCYLWNTDYPNADRADFLKIPSGAASNSAIVGYGKSTNRLFLFTSSSTHTWDQQQLLTKYDDIGCANHNTIRVVGDWLLWLDSEARVIAYNESTGQKEFISKAIKKKVLKYVTSSNLAEAAAGRADNIYKLHLGTVNGNITRVCYDFDQNNWVTEHHTRKMLQHVISNRNGTNKIYFLDNTGKLFQDDIGDLDDTVTIPLKVKYGRNNSGTIFQKSYTGFYIVGQNLSGLKCNVYLNGKPTPISLPVEILDNGFYAQITVGDKAVDARDINIELSHRAKGDPVAIEGYVPFMTAEERRFGG